jgi:hypothetical protein
MKTLILAGQSTHSQSCTIDLGPQPRPPPRCTDKIHYETTCPSGWDAHASRDLTTQSSHRRHPPAHQEQEAHTHDKQPSASTTTQPAATLKHVSLLHQAPLVCPFRSFVHSHFLSLVLSFFLSFFPRLHSVVSCYAPAVSSLARVHPCRVL